MADLDREQYLEARQQRITQAITTVKTLFTKYSIHGRDVAKQAIEEEFTQTDLDAYRTAKKVLLDEGAIG